MITKEEAEIRKNMRTKLNAETARLSWTELERHFARGAVIRVVADLDMIDVAAAIADDEKAVIEAWMSAGQVGHPDMDDAKDWVERQPDFWTVVIAPWVLIQEVKTMRLESEKMDFSLAYYAGDRNTGAVTVVRRQAGELDIKQLPVGAESGKDKALKPIFVGLSDTDQIITLDPESKAISLSDHFIPDAFPAHIYSDPNSNRDFFMCDGDKKTGNDTLNCGDGGSSVTVVENTATSSAKFLKTICVGRGHHQANFSYPSEHAPNVPSQAYTSNLIDGSLSVIGNDPEKADEYLKVIATINLCETDKEDFDEPQSPNNAFPHGLVYSKISGKIYNLNNGYGNIVVIDPITHQIEQRISFKGFSNLFMSPCGRYVIGRGADRKSDPQHCVAKLAVFDVTTNEMVSQIDLPDVYVSKYFFNKEGNKLYLTTSSSGNDEQKANLKSDAVLVFDLSVLPALSQVAELRLGSPVGTLDFLVSDTGASLVFASNSQAGVVTLIDGNNNEVLETLDVIEPQSHSRLWLLES